MSNHCSSYIRRYLMPDERVITVSRIHSGILKSLLISFVLGILLAFTGTILATPLDRLMDRLRTDQFQALLIIAMILGGGFLTVWSLIGVLLQWAERSKSEFVCTNKRVLIKSGILVTNLNEMPLTQVVAIGMEQGMLGKLMGFASLSLTGSGGTKLTCNNLENPQEFYKTINNARRSDRA
jgi:membrane protein YdbS with pleckstrin-like domain